MNSLSHKLIVFDWNGTLLADTVPSWKAANACLEFYDREPISLQRYRETFHFPVMHFYKRNNVSVDEVLAKKDEGNAFYQKTYESLVTSARTRRGARPLLSWIAQQNITAIILSNYLTDRIEEQLQRLKMDHYFQHVDAHNCDGTTILQNTTKAKRLSNFMAEHNHKPEDTVIVGDSMEEPEIARALGLTSIGITDGYITRARLKKSAPDHIINALPEIKPLLKSKWSLPP